ARSRLTTLLVLADRSGRAVLVAADDDRRAVVPVAQVEADGEPLAFHRPGEALTDTCSLGISFGSVLEQQRACVLPRREHLHEVRRRLLGDAHRNWTPLDRIGVEQEVSAPAAQDGLELPGQIDG